MEYLGLQVAVLGDPKHVFYLTGYLTEEERCSAVILESGGRCILVAPASDEALAVDELLSFQPSTLCTLRLDQPRTVAQKVGSVLSSANGLIGLDKGRTSGFLAELTGSCVDLDPELIDLRRFKEEDELALLKRGIEITHFCYARAREILGPGIPELEIYTELYRTAVETAGEKLPAMGNDFQCGSPGGPPRLRRTVAGELYILDLGVQYSGYFADNCRTFSVDREPSKTQKQAWSDIVQVFSMIEDQVRPGVSCAELFEEVKGFLEARWPGSFFHHLGHGVGLSPHERPNLNPHWSQTFREGDFFTVEPGLYEPELRGGIRLEENYLVTVDGVEKLTSFPLDL